MNDSWGQYSLQEKIGEGGMGTVYKAYDNKLGRIVALKHLQRLPYGSSSEMTRFSREARAMAAMNHPFIVKIYDVVNLADKSFIVMEYVLGNTLSEHIATKKPSLRKIIEINIKVAEATEYVHQQGIIHRDLKPENIMIDEQGNPKVMDFGLARMENDTKISKSGMILGSLKYLSPEQAMGNLREVDEQSDVYGLGAILYESITGLPPHSGSTSFEILLKISNEEVTPPREVKPTIPKDLDSICWKALEKKKHRRYASAEDFKIDLIRFFQRDNSAKTKWSERILFLVRRHRKIVWQLAIVVLLFSHWFVFWRQEISQEQEKVISKAISLHERVNSAILRGGLKTHHYEIQRHLSTIIQNIEPMYHQKPLASFRILLGNSYMKRGIIALLPTKMEQEIIQSPDYRNKILRHFPKIKQVLPKIVADLQKAEQLLGKAGSGDLYYYLGLVKHYQKNYSSAIHYYQKALSRNEELANVDYILSMVYREQAMAKRQDWRATKKNKDEEQADLYYQKALYYLNQALSKSISGQSWLFWQQANIHLENHQQEKALESLFMATQAEPSFTAAWMLKGQIFFASEQYNESLKAYEQVIHHRPKYWLAHVHKGVAILASKQQDKEEKSVLSFKEALWARGLEQGAPRFIGDVRDKVTKDSFIAFCMKSLKPWFFRANANKPGKVALLTLEIYHIRKKQSKEANKKVKQLQIERDRILKELITELGNCH